MPGLLRRSLASISPWEGGGGRGEGTVRRGLLDV